MRLTVSILCFVMMPLLAQFPPDPVDGPGWVENGVQAYREGRYPAAVDAFRRAVDLSPNDVNARLRLGNLLMAVYVHAADVRANAGNARRAESEFETVLRLEPNNQKALLSLAYLSYREAQGIQDNDQKFHKLDESASWYQKVLAMDPRNKEAYYATAVIDWSKWYPEVFKARAQLAMRPDEPGPLKDPALRRELRERYSSVIEDGISKLQKALDIDPAYHDAMAYMNLMLRYRADLVDSPEQYRQEIEAANEWAQKARAAKKNGPRGMISVPIPHPPLPPSSGPSGAERIRVGGDIQQFNLIHRGDPAYPPLARQARILGTVRFTAIIGGDGRVLNLQLVSGHPLLVEAARQAVMQWLYKPALLNGQPVEVVTQIDVGFSLSEAELQ
jgi:TonB family protein